jgi:uncharacterized protein YabE (DUF348 family)
MPDSFITRRRLWFMALILLGLGSLTAAGYLVAQGQYTVYADDAAHTVSGNYDSVDAVVAAAGVALRPEDLLIPSGDSRPDPETAIRVQRARPVRVRSEQDGARTIWTQQTKLAPFLAEAEIEVGRTDQVFADGVQVPFGTWGSTAVPRVLEIGRFLTVTIRQGEEQRTIRTAADTVGEALAEAGIALYAADGVTPPLGAWLEPDTVIVVQRSMPLTIEVDGRVIQTRSHHSNPLDVLAQVGVGLVGEDYTAPGPETTLRANDTIRVIRVTEDFRVEDEPIPFQTVWQGSDELEIDQKAVISPGAPGVRRQRIRVRYENGVEVSRTVDGEWVAREPVNEVIGYGTRIVLRTVDTPEGPRQYWRKIRMRVTSYTAATSGKSPDDPGYGITASGRPAGYGVVAVDRSVVPFRSNVFVPGYGVAFVGDTGGGVRGRWIDLGYDEENYRSWSGYVDVYYLAPVPPPEDINYLLPDEAP